MKDSIQHRLLQYKETPSPNLWNAISASLDEELNVGSRLYNYEQEPPAGLWQKLEPAIATGNESKPIFINSRSKRILRYAAAASIIGIVAISVALLFNQKADTTASVQQPVLSNPIQKPVDTKEKTDSGSDNLASQKPDRKKSGSNTSTATVQNKPRTDYNSNNALAINDNRYTTMEDEDGKEVRLSKKAYSVFNCAENSLAARRKDCRETIKSMQETMASSVGSPAADFGGLLDIIKALEEKNN